MRKIKSIGMVAALFTIAACSNGGSSYFGSLPEQYSKVEQEEKALEEKTHSKGIDISQKEFIYILQDANAIVERAKKDYEKTISNLKLPKDIPFEINDSVKCSISNIQFVKAQVTGSKRNFGLDTPAVKLFFSGKLKSQKDSTSEHGICLYSVFVDEKGSPLAFNDNMLNPSWTNYKCILNANKEYDLSSFIYNDSNLKDFHHIAFVTQYQYNKMMQEVDKKR